MPHVGYSLEDGTVVRFELDAGGGFRLAGADEVVGRLRDAATPVVAGAKALLDAVREVDPDEVVVIFGVKVSGTANW